MEYLLSLSTSGFFIKQTYTRRTQTLGSVSQIIKFDMELRQGIEANSVRKKITQKVVMTAHEPGIEDIAEGIGDHATFREIDIRCCRDRNTF